MKHSFVFLADGFEEIEAVTPVDVMRRAGLDVKTVSITDSHVVTGAHGVKYTADMLISEVPSSDVQWLVLPGGMPGAENLYNCKALTDMLRRHAAEGGKIAAICASPGVVLGQLGLLDGKEATCYPGFEGMLGEKCFHVPVPVVSAENVVTGNGPAAALPFSLAIVAATLGEGHAKEIASQMQYPKP